MEARRIKSRSGCTSNMDDKFAELGAEGHKIFQSQEEIRHISTLNNSESHIDALPQIILDVLPRHTRPKLAARVDSPSFSHT